MIKGIAVHETLRDFYSLEMSLDSDLSWLRLQIIHLFQKAWARQQDRLQQLDLEPAVIDEHYRECMNMLYGWFFRFAEKASLGLSKPRTEVKLFSKRLRLMGIIDAIYTHNNTVVLVDYKTSRKDEITRELKTQMKLYALLYRERFRRLPDILCIDFLATGTKKYFNPSQDMVDGAEKLNNLIHARTLSRDLGDYPCQCGGKCGLDFENEGAAN